ncbi:MAG: hypothetical protein OXC12_00055 [Spirochaetaceae bacterium]|nr:hypothetical protein [Spirochaetaceae bacterium]
MGIELMQYLSVVVAGAALSVVVLHAVRGSMIRAELRRLQRRYEDLSGRAGPPAGGSGMPGGGPTDAPADGASDAGTDRSPETGEPGVGAPEGGNSPDPRRLEDMACRRIAYQLIAILAVVIFSLLAMVAFGVIAVDDVDKFGVIVAPVVTLVTAATSSYYAHRRSGK